MEEAAIIALMVTRAPTATHAPTATIAQATPSQSTALPVWIRMPDAAPKDAIASWNTVVPLVMGGMRQHNARNGTIKKQQPTRPDEARTEQNRR